ncbi:MAG TPA: RpiB/LacA/LacB family sugar-phosphate isomerase [Tepidisphaeraceae bacterium]|nr:RpiB/LacA/LacB family sugar-phosphate isomerase [Tepidisphaeraceae bacterium]
MIFTARQLQDLHKTNGHVTVPVGARVTPLAQDWLRAKKVVLRYGTNGAAMQPPAASAVGPALVQQKPLPLMVAPAGTLLWWCDGPCGQAKGAIAAQARESSLEPLDIPASSDNLLPAIKQVARQVNSGRASGGILLVQSGAAAIVYANRYPALRAILGTCRQSVEQGVQHVAANVLVIEYPYHSLPQVRNILIPFVRGRREISEDVQRQLAELSSCA